MSRTAGVGTGSEGADLLREVSEIAGGAVSRRRSSDAAHILSLSPFLYPSLVSKVK